MLDVEDAATAREILIGMVCLMVNMNSNAMNTTTWSITRYPGQAEPVRIRGHDELAWAWGRWIGRVPWEVMVTGTFDPKRVSHPSCRVADKEALWWCGLLGKVWRRPVAWVYAVERGLGGRWHMHGLIVGSTGLSWETPIGCWTERNGRLTVSPVRDEGAALYTTKSASRTGMIVLSDTMGRYRDRLRPDVVVSRLPDQFRIPAFGTVTEAVRALALIEQSIPQMIVVGIGYPVGVYWNAIPQRSIDRSPTKDATWEAENAASYTRFPRALGSGGAPDFLRFISDELMPFVKGGVKLDHGGGGKPDHPAAGRSS